MLIEKINTAESRFPWDIFTPEIYQSFKDLSKNEDIPLDFLGVQALYAVAALSGNMYVGYMGGIVKPIMFIAKIGPSGVGKTPAFRNLIGTITAPLRIRYQQEHETAVEQYHQRERDAKKMIPKMDFDEKPPVKRIRIAEGATAEALAKHSTTSPAGFGLIYDEGERMFGDVNKYNNGGDSNGFWNELFNGDIIDTLRVDSTRERFIQAPAISVDIGLQSKRMAKYFTDDAIASGILNRFLIVETGYIKLSETVDFFSEKCQAHDDWKTLVRYLFQKGFAFNHGEAIAVKVHPDDIAYANNMGGLMKKKSNEIISVMKEGDPSEYLVAYRSKLFTYFKRMSVILAIMHDPKNPIITRRELDGAKKLCIYFEKNAYDILKRLFNTSATGLSEKEQQLLDSLPEEFTSSQASEYCEALGLSPKFFLMTMTRKYSKGLVRKMGKGKYEKM